jgi:NAD(P)-dependent dehydrogenase (short-subunit alcohol dehydrogenase family)
MHNPLDFSGKVALITGAAAGMGLAASRMFAYLGARVVLADFKEQAVQAAAQSLVAAGHKAIAMVAPSRLRSNHRSARYFGFYQLET